MARPLSRIAKRKVSARLDRTNVAGAARPTQTASKTTGAREDSLRFDMSECRLRSAPAANFARRAGAFACESLEPRQLLSSFVYSDLAGTVGSPEASLIVDDYNGPIANVGDIDGDGVTDLLIGRFLTSYIALPGGPGSYVNSGAVLISGATSAAIRTHAPTGFGYFGMGVAGLGDVDADGAPDYAISTAGLTGFGSDNLAIVYSGKTGQPLYQFSGPGDLYRSTMIAAAGDMNDDGHADFLFGSRGDTSVTLYSGMDGAVLRIIDGLAPSGLLGGVDFNGDGASDIAVTDIDAENAVKIFSGADGSLLINAAIGAPVRVLDLRSGADLNSDGTPDLLITPIEPPLGPTLQGTRSRAVSGATGAVLYVLTGPTPDTLAGPAAIIQDVNLDGTPDLAATVYLSARAGALNLYSGRDGSLITALTDDGPASRPPLDPWGPGSRYMRLQGGVATADLNGDGFAELITAAMAFSERGGSTGSSHLLDHGRILSFDGSKLGTPIFEGAITPYLSSSFVAWGHIGASGFIYRNGRLTYLHEMEGFSTNDRILLYQNRNNFDIADNWSAIVVAPDGDASRARVWFGDRNLNYLGTLFFDQVITGTPPAGDYTFTRVAAVTSQAIYFEQSRDGTTPTAWRLTFTVTDHITAGEMSYVIDGSLVGASKSEGAQLGAPAEQVVTIPLDDPSSTVVSLLGVSTTTLTGFRATAVSTFATIVGVAQRDGDPLPRPYAVAWDRSEFVFGRMSGLEGGSDWNPTHVVGSSGYAGTYKDAQGKTSIFVFPFLVSGAQAIDPLKEQLLGAPDAAFEEPTLLGYGDALWITADGASHQAQLADVSKPGPFLSPSDASFAISPTVYSISTEDGSVVVSRNAAGELFVYASGRWSQVFNQYGEPAYSAPFYGDIVAWGIGSHPDIALATPDGLFLIESFVHLTSGPGGIYTTSYRVRNLTSEIPGSKAITQSLVTLLPQNGLRLLAGLITDGELVMYGLTEPQSREPYKQSKWAYANLFDQVSRPAAIPDPVFDPANNGPLISYVTSWDGLNIAGVSNGEVITYWTSPAIQGWRYANITQSASAAGSPALDPFKNISAYITPWGGMNIVGTDRLHVYWWAPGLTDWQTDRLVDEARGPELRSETLTTFVSSWGGLNIAGLDENNRLWIYWWAPGQPRWTASNLDAELSEPDRRFKHAGRLAATVSAADETYLFSRTPFGNTIQYTWSPVHAWEAKPLL